MRRPGVGMVGRADELDVVSARILGVSGGLASVILVEGEAGIGKSHLCSIACELAADHGFVALHGRAEELGGVPLALLGAALTPLRRDDDVGGLLRRFDDGVTSSPPVRTTEIFVELLEGLCLHGPVLLWLDDLQWADDASLSAVRSLTRRLSDLPLAVLAAYRGQPPAAAVSPIVDELRAAGALHLALKPLDPDAVGQLAAERLGSEPGPSLALQLASAGGNPLHVEQLCAAFAEAELIEGEEAKVALTGAALPATLCQTILRRVRLLGERTLDLLSVASVLGSSFDLDHLASMMGCRAATVAAGLDAAVAAEIVDVGGTRYTFRHDLLRDAMYESMPRGVRGRLHVEAARVLEDAHRHLEEIAPHLVVGATADDPSSVDLLVKYGRSAGVASPALAVTLLERALTLLGECDPRHDQVAASLIGPLNRQGRAPEAEVLAREVYRRPHDPSLSAALRRGVVEALANQGKVLEMCGELETAVSRGDLDGDERSQLAGRLSQARMLAGDFECAGRLGDEVLADARSRGDDHLVGFVLTTLARVALAEGKVHAAVAAGEEAAALPRSVDDDRAVDLFRGITLIHVDRLGEARSALLGGRRHDTETGYLPMVPGYHWALAHLGYLTGRWDEATAEAEAGLALVAEGVGTAAASSMARAVLARVALHRGDLRSARSHVEQGLAETGPGHFDPCPDMVLWAGALLQESEGDPGSARQALEGVWEESKKVRGLTSWRTWSPDLVRLSIATGAMERAVEVAEDTEELALRAAGVASAAAATMRCRGLIEGDGARLSRAAELFAISGRPVEAALALEDAARAFEDRGSFTEAVELLRQAGATYAAHGAVRDLDRLTAALRHLGVRRGGPSLKIRPLAGWGALTSTEARVAELVASGLTNRRVADLLYISPRTVGSHLEHIFVKLGISSRLELVTHRSMAGAAR